MTSGVWICPACETDNQSSTEICAACGCANSPTEEDLAARIEAARKKPNTITVWEALWSIVAIPVCAWYAWTYVSAGTARFSLSRNSRTELEVMGPYSSLLVALAMLALASFFLSRLSDHFDVRDNEQSYRRFALWTWVAMNGLLVLAVYVGWKFEFIRAVPK